MKSFFEENVFISDLDAILCLMIAILCLVKLCFWSHELPGWPLIRVSLHVPPRIIWYEEGSCLHTHDFLICFV